MTVTASMSFQTENVSCNILKERNVERFNILIDGYTDHYVDDNKSWLTSKTIQISSKGLPIDVVKIIFIYFSHC